MDQVLSEMQTKILDSAISLLESGGEPAVRLRSVAKLVGISQPTLYYYFKDREELIIAAHIRRLKKNLATTIDPFLASVTSCSSREDFLEVLLNVYRHSFQSGRSIVREIRTELIGAAIQRELLRQAVVAEINLSLEASISAIEVARENGWVRPSMNSTAFANFNFSLISGAVFIEIQHDDELLNSWIDLAFQAITAIVMADD